MNKHSLEIPLYLNQKIVFDLLASINDGISQVTKMRTASKSNGEVETGLDADLGNKNIFTLMAVKLKGKIGTEKNNEQEQEKIQAGEFVEITGVLKINPLISMMENMIQLMELATAMNGDGTGKRAKQQRLEDKTTINQMKAFANSLKGNGMVDMICELDGFIGGKAVLPIYMDYFFHGNSGEVIDGKFKVLGKVAKVCDENEKIDLLRNTSLSLFKENILGEFLKMFNGELNQDINVGEIETIIKGPALLIIPIAIYL